MDSLDTELVEHLQRVRLGMLRALQHLGLIRTLLTRWSDALIHFSGGGEKAVTKHRSRNKLLARERIDALLDDG